MRQTTIPYPEVGVIAATRMMAGAGIGLLVASKMSSQKRKAVGWPLLAIGAISTIPLAIDVYRRSQPVPPKQDTP